MGPSTKDIASSQRVARAKGRKPRPLRVAVSDGSELFADRTVRLLNDMGIDAGRWRPGDSRLRNWRKGLEVDLFLYVSGRRRLHKLQTSLGRLGVPTIIRWIGSDVSLESAGASETVKTMAWHWCVAPWLQAELEEAGVAADVVPLTLTDIPDHATGTSERVLRPRLHPGAATMTSYGRAVRHRVREETSRRSIQADRDDDRRRSPGNVLALGWVDDVRALMAQTTVYVRPTVHDGLSNLVLEALARGRYVWWTYPFPGVEAAGSAGRRRPMALRTEDETCIGGQLGLNHPGRDAVMTMFDPGVVGNDIRRAIGGDRGPGLEALPGVVRPSGWRVRSSRL